MEKSAKAFFDSANGTFHLASMAIGSQDVEMNIGEIMVNAIEF